jgi:hypothetical protein
MCSVLTAGAELGGSHHFAWTGGKVNTWKTSSLNWVRWDESHHSGPAHEEGLFLTKKNCLLCVVCSFVESDCTANVCFAECCVECNEYRSEKQSFLPSLSPERKCSTFQPLGVSNHAGAGFEIEIELTMADSRVFRLSLPPKFRLTIFAR